MAKKNAAPETPGADGDSEVRKTAQKLLDAVIEEFRPIIGIEEYPRIKLDEVLSWKIILEQNLETQAYIVRTMLDRILAIENEIVSIRSNTSYPQRYVDQPDYKKYRSIRCILMQIIRELLRHDLPLTESDLTHLVRWAVYGVGYIFLDNYPLEEITRLFENAVESKEANRELQSSLEYLVLYLREVKDKDCRKIANRLQAILPQIAIGPGEAWSDVALADLRKIISEHTNAWKTLLIHCQTGGYGKFTPRWHKDAEPLIEAVGFDVLKEHLLRWFPLVDKQRTHPITHRNAFESDHDNLIIDPHVELLRGLVWCCGLKEDLDLARALAHLAISAYRKIPGKGPRLVSLGNACVTALGMMPGRAPIGQLAVLKVKVKFGTAQKEIEKAFNASATREGLPRDEIEELAVPSYGLEEVGRLRESFGDYRAELTIDGSAAGLQWFKEDKPIKSVPAAVKKEHPAELKELQTAVKDVNTMLPAQRERIDALYLAQKSWPLSLWHPRYLDHPLIGTIARRLIWSFTANGKTNAGIWHDGQIVGPAGKPLSIKDSATVSLWHPIGREMEEVLAWRDWLERREVVQPFKQAHREVYLLTDAEQRTRTYSNRFAAHVLRQHQFNALCAARGWKNKLRLMVDDSYPPAHRLLPAWNLRAEYWIEGAGEEYGQDTNEAGAFLHLTTDQVRFYEINASQLYAHAGGGGYGRYQAQDTDEPVPLETIPPLVFSEIMRDVDLFVGVASVGNDPNWSDGGPNGQYRDYWQSYSFGELSATAQTRRTLLERLLPRLKIADRCTLAERFLIVRGTLRDYKIHLGSGNILMTPNDQYLCIVPKQSAASPDGGKVFLPFEGDNMLSIILSKAFLLAEDAKITDPSITSQLKR